MTHWNDIWPRLARGEHLAVLAPWLPPPEPTRLRAVVVDCAFAAGVGGCLEEARRRVEARLNEEPQALFGSALTHVRWGVRRHLLNEAPGAAELERMLETFGRAKGGDSPMVLVLRSVDQADATSLRLLQSLLNGPLGLPIPTLFWFETRSPEGDALGLLQTLENKLDASAILRPEPEALAGAADRACDPLRELPGAVRTTLRAAATLGDRFESEVLAALLGRSEAEILVHLQQAVDAGLALEDRGHGRFSCDRELGNGIRRYTLPSLSRAWHQKLAQIFGGPPAPDKPRTRQGPAARSAAAPGAARPPGPGAAPTSPRPEQLFEPAPSKLPKVPDAEDAWQRALRDLAARRVSLEPRASLSDPEFRQAAALDWDRAGSHAEAAGDIRGAAENYLASAHRAAEAGAHGLALKHAERAEQLLSDLPATAALRRSRASALLGMARARWLGTDRPGETTLASALEPLERCKQLLANEADPELVAELGSLYASVCYDIGTAEALEQALRELTEAGRRLLELNEPLLAAELLNDEAALWVRIGDPVRAHHLLSRSREVFSKVIGSHPSALRELAETEHMVARLMLHALPREGRERDALRLGVEHALSAEEGYLSLGDRWQVARVHETLGRLQARQQNLDAATHYLSQARSAQLELGDVVGLARSTAALSQVFAEAGDARAALGQLEDSVDLNVQKGSVAGLRFNLEGLEQLLPGLPQNLAGEGRNLHQRLRQLLAPIPAGDHR